MITVNNQTQLHVMLTAEKTSGKASSSLPRSNDPKIILINAPSINNTVATFPILLTVEVPRE
jgi:hypothetical protein